MVLFHYLHLFVLGCFCLEMAEEVKVKRHTPFLPEDHSWPGEPEFGKTVRNLTAVANSTVSLRCPIGRVQDSAISFVRMKDFRILSNGHQVFTGDDRVEILHRAKTIDWILKIRRVRFSDQGRYECQVSIKSGLYSLPFELWVVSPEAHIDGDNNEFHVDRGSEIRLVCRVSHQSAQFVFWYHNQRMINYDSEEGLDVFTEANTSTLTIASAEKKHAGNYTCAPSNVAKGATILVFVSASAVDFAAEASYFNPEDGIIANEKQDAAAAAAQRLSTTVVVVMSLLCVLFIN